MSRITGALSTAGRGLFGWVARYVGWLALTTIVTLAGVSILMLFKDWTIKSLFTSMMAWPALGLAMLVAVPVAFLQVGRIYLYSAFGGGLLYSLFVLIA
ncbi:MAG: hypothetical protein U9Q81_15285 [Pseudomonadota bacterium]|nr:hypothetical protein [Pseudomonadota bacterium]